MDLALQNDTIFENPSLSYYKVEWVRNPNFAFPNFIF